MLPLLQLLRITIISLFLTQCGYHTHEKEVSPQQRLTISIPYFSGDQDGMLTDTIIKQLCTSPSFAYKNQGGTLILEGQVLDDSYVDIGYQYDRQPVSGKIIHRLVPNEGRRTITVRISLIDGYSHKVLHGPFDLSASSDYDFFNAHSSSFIGSMGQPQSTLFFSLGQLDSEQGAHEHSRIPLHECLANKIIEGIAHLSYKKNSKKCSW